MRNALLLVLAAISIGVSSHLCKLPTITMFILVSVLFIAYLLSLGCDMIRPKDELFAHSLWWLDSEYLVNSLLRKPSSLFMGSLGLTIVLLHGFLIILSPPNEDFITALHVGLVFILVACIRAKWKPTT